MTHTLNNNLKVLRAKFNLTQQQLADKACVSRKTINTIENGVYTPSVMLALSIAKIFDTQLEHVFYLDRTEPNDTDSF